MGEQLVRNNLDRVQNARAALSNRRLASGNLEFRKVHERFPTQTDPFEIEYHGQDGSRRRRQRKVVGRHTDSTPLLEAISSLKSAKYEFRGNEIRTIKDGVAISFEGMTIVWDRVTKDEVDKLGSGVKPMKEGIIIDITRDICEAENALGKSFPTAAYKLKHAAGLIKNNSDLRDMLIFAAAALEKESPDALAAFRAMDRARVIAMATLTKSVGNGKFSEQMKIANQYVERKTALESLVGEAAEELHKVKSGGTSGYSKETLALIGQLKDGLELLAYDQKSWDEVFACALRVIKSLSGIAKTGGGFDSLSEVLRDLLTPKSLSDYREQLRETSAIKTTEGVSRVIYWEQREKLSETHKLLDDVAAKMGGKESLQEIREIIKELVKLKRVSGEILHPKPGTDELWILSEDARRLIKLVNVSEKHKIGKNPRYYEIQGIPVERERLNTAIAEFERGLLGAENFVSLIKGIDPGIVDKKISELSGLKREKDREETETENPALRWLLIREINMLTRITGYLDEAASKRQTD